MAIRIKNEIFKSKDGNRTEQSEAVKVVGPPERSWTIVDNPPTTLDEEINKVTVIYGEKKEEKYENDKTEATDEKTDRIIIVGVGKAGNNVVNRMIDENMAEAEFIGIGTDEEALQQCKAPKRLLISGKSEGFDSRLKATKKVAVASVEKIKAAVSEADMVFVICGMGGSTGIGIAPVVAKAIKDLGIWTIGIVTKPFRFESNTRRVNAERGIVRMQDCVDNLLVISDKKQNIGCRLSIPDALKKTDEVIWKTVQAMVEGVTGQSNGRTSLSPLKRYRWFWNRGRYWQRW